MPRRRGSSRGAGSRRTTFLDTLINAVVGEVRDRTKTVRPPSARQEARLPREPSGNSPRVGGVRLGLRREGEAFTDYSGDAFRGELSNADASTAVQDVIARRMRALGIEPSADVEAVDVATEAGSFARRLSWELRIAGTHAPSGLSNMELLRIRQSEGRDFAEDTASLREHVRSEVASQMGATWDDDRAARIASDAIVGWILRRLDEGGLDVDLTPLAASTVRFKREHGLDPRVGIATGAWRRAVARAEAIVTA